MNMMKSVLLGLLSGVTVLCLPLAQAYTPKARVSLISGGTAVFYRGDLEESAITRVENLLKKNPSKIKRLVIDSGGGEVNLGMDLGALVLENQLDVVVDKLCASSCANYVFPAGKNKLINPGAVVVWHGSVIQAGLEDGPGLEDIEFPDGVKRTSAEKLKLLEKSRKEFAQYFADVKKRQEVYFKRLGVDARVTVMGHDLKVSDEWTLSPADMAYFGINNVTAPADYGRVLPADVAKRGVMWLQLKDYPAYRTTR